MKKENNEITEMFDSLSKRAGYLTSGQLEFVKSLRRHYKRTKQLSERQMKVLYEIQNMLESVV